MHYPIEQNAKLQLYVQLLLEEGDRLGLTAFREAEPIWRELIDDSASAAQLLPQGGKVIDLGSGGGCPGIVLQVLRPDTQFTLLEANGRKCGFLRRVVESLQLPTQVIQERSEILAHQSAHRESYDVVTAKAVAAMPTLVELALPLLRVGGLLLAYKGPQAQQEVDQAAFALKTLQGQTANVLPYQLGEKNYCHVLIEKLGPSQSNYPRRPGVPAKQPLQASASR
jgi:16S rRNA (guanine527-N7)-methyltransferase